MRASVIVFSAVVGVVGLLWLPFHGGGTGGAKTESPAGNEVTPRQQSSARGKASARGEAGGLATAQPGHPVPDADALGYLAAWSTSEIALEVALENAGDTPVVAVVHTLGGIAGVNHQYPPAAFPLDPGEQTLVPITAAPALSLHPLQETYPTAFHGRVRWEGAAGRHLASSLLPPRYFLPGSPPSFGGAIARDAYAAINPEIFGLSRLSALVQQRDSVFASGLRIDENLDTGENVMVVGGASGLWERRPLGWTSPTGELD